MLFSSAHDLWSSFQNLIDDDFDYATIHDHDPIIYRPDYDKVAGILDGNNNNLSTSGCK